MVSTQHSDIVNIFRNQLEEFRYKKLTSISKKPINYRPDLFMFKIGIDDYSKNCFKLVIVEVVTSNFSGFPEKDLIIKQFNNSIKMRDVIMNKDFLKRKSNAYLNKPINDIPAYHNQYKGYYYYIWFLLVDPKAVFTIGKRSYKLNFMECTQYYTLKDLKNTDELF